jgi:hypothetical protein
MKRVGNWPEGGHLLQGSHLRYEAAVGESLRDFIPDYKGENLGLEALAKEHPGRLGGKNPTSGDRTPIFERNAEPKGPMSVFGYDYFEDKLGREAAGKVRLLRHRGLWGGGDMYAYEVLNFVDGKRTAQEIHDAVSAEFGPVELELVIEYLRALEKIGVVKEVKK